MSTAASQALVQKLYVAYYGRPADPAGLEAWALAIDANKGQVSTAIVNAFGASAESTALFGNMSTSQKVNAIYKQLFGRDAEPAGLLAWATAIDGGRVSAAGAALEILNGAAGDDKTTINNKLSAAAAFTAALDTTAEITAYSGDTVANAARSFLAGVTTAAPSTDAVNTAVASVTNTSGSGSNEAGKPYVLTTNQDILTGTNSNDNFRAVAGKADGQQDQTTLNSSDIIDGGAGTADALIVNLVGGNYGGGARIKNVETLQIGTNDSTVRTFDYNVNMGSNEITEATKVVYDQINAGEHLSVVNLLKTGEAIPTLSWTNEANSLAGTISADFRQSAVEGNKTAATVELNNVLADPNVATTGRLNIGAGVETLNIVSGGSSAYNTLNASQRTDGSAVDIVSAGFSTNAASVVTGEGVNDDGSLSTVNVTGSRAFGKAATVVTDTTNTNFGLTNRAVAGDVGLDNLQPSASNLVSLAATVTTLNAAEATGDTNIRFTSRVDAAEVNVTYKGGKANDYVEFQQGNINATGGDGNDTFAFVNTQNNSTLTTADTIVGGAGTDTIQMGVNGAGTYNLDTTEFNNKTGVDVLDLRGNVNNVRLADAFVGAADAGLTVRTDKIVQTSDTSTANSTTATTNNGLEEQSTNTLNLTALSANRAVDFIGGAGSDRIVVNEVSLNSNVKLDGGTNITNSGRFDTITVQDSAVLSRGDLAGVKGFEGIVLVKSDTTSARQYTVEVTESFLNANGNSKVLQIGTINAANQNKLTAADTVTIDVSDLLVSSNATFKTTGYDRKIDVTSLTAAGATVNFTANGGSISLATLQGLGLVTTTADAKQADILASVANQGTLGTAPSTGGSSVPGTTITSTSAVTVSNLVPFVSGTESKLLTDNADTITINSTLGTSFIVDAKSGDGDVLNAQLTAASTATVIGIETLNLTTLGSSASLDLGNVTGNSLITVKGTNVAFTNAAATDVFSFGSDFTGTANITGAAGADAYTVKTNTANFILKNATSTGLTLDNTGSSTVDFTGTAALTSTKVKGVGTIELKAVATNNVVDASALTGNLVYNQAAAADASVTGGSGNDTFSFTSGLFNGTDSINGGAGTDTLKIIDAGTVTLTNVSNVENIVLSGGAASLTFATTNLSLGQTLNVNGSAMTGALTTAAPAGSSDFMLNVTGSAQNDTLAGWNRADTISGGAGDDNISGGAGVDTITTGTGADRVVLASASADRDVVTDFTVGAGNDTIQLTAANTKVGTAVGAAPVVTADTSAAAAGGAAYALTMGAITTATTDVIVLQNGAALTSGTNGGDLSLTTAAGLNGTELLKALTSNAAADTYTQITAVGTDAAAYLVAYQGGNAYVYLASDAAAAGGNGDGAWQAGEIQLVGTLQNVAANGLVAGNYAVLA